MKSTNFGSRCLVDRLTEGDEIWQIDREGLAVTVGPGTPWGAKILRGLKKFCNAFLVHRLADHNEIWHSNWHWCIADIIY